MDKPKHTATVVAKNQLTDHVHELVLSVASEPAFSFTAGQFINVHVPQKDKVVTRSYSIASSPTEPQTLLLTYKYLPGGAASNYFKQMSVGDVITFDGPQGHFVLRESTKPIQYIVTGTGIAPIMAMVHTITDAPAVHIWFGLRHEDDIFWKEKLEAFKEKNSWFDYTICLSDAQETWQGTHGRVTEHCDKIAQNPDSHFYLCGSPKMVIDMRKRLLEQGVLAKNIFFEIFS